MVQPMPQAVGPRGGRRGGAPMPLAAPAEAAGKALPPAMTLHEAKTK